MHHDSSLTTLTSLTQSRQRTEALGAAMFELYASTGEATETMLLREGYSRFELETMGPAARQIAEGRRIRVDQQLSGRGFTRTDDELVAIAVSAAAGALNPDQIALSALAAGIPAAEIGRLWQKITRKLAAQLALTKAPADLGESRAASRADRQQGVA